MLSLRPFAVVVSLLVLLLFTAQAMPSTASPILRPESAATSVSDCAAQAAYCVFLPLMRVPAPPPTLEPLAIIPGDTVTVELSGSYAYISQADVMYVVDVSNPRQPRVVGGLQLKGLRLPFVHDIEVQPPLAYVSTADRFTSCCLNLQVHLVDIAQPALPRLISSIDGIGGGDIEVVGKQVYATSLPWITPIPDLAIADVVGSSGFLKRGSYGSSGSWSVAVKDSIVYVSDNENGILVIDASNPDSLVLLKSISTPDMPYSIEIDGSYLYVSMTNSIGILDITTPQAPVWRSTRQILGFPMDLEVVDGRAYVAVGAVGLSILDVRNPDEMELLTTYQAAGPVNAVEVDGSLIYLAGSNGLHIVQVAAQ